MKAILVITLVAATAAHAQQTSSGQAVSSPEVSVTGDLRVNTSRTGGQANIFDARTFELGLQSTLAQLGMAKVFVTDGPQGVRVDEGYVAFTSLPYHLRVDAGKFRMQMGELNRWHEHALPEDEYPLVIRRFAGVAGLVGTGVSVQSTLGATPLGGSYDVTVQATNADNPVLFFASPHPAVSGQLAGTWHPGHATSARVSVGGMYGTNPDSSLETKLGVVAARIEWARNETSGLTVRGELWHLDRQYTLAGFAPTAFGARLGGYGDVIWTMNPRWSASARGDYAQSPELGTLAHEWAITPTLTYRPNEFVLLRGIVEHSDDVTNVLRDRLSVQVVFSAGPHARETY